MEPEFQSNRPGDESMAEGSLYVGAMQVPRDKIKHVGLILDRIKVQI